MACRLAQSRARKSSISDPRVNRTREHIVEAFTELCGERGMQAVSIAEIARRAGVNRATFYRHFEGKTDLLERGIETLLGGILDDIEAIAPVGSAPEDRVLQRMARFFEVARDRSELFRLLISGAAGHVLHDKAEAFVDGFLRERRLGIAAEGTLALPLALASRVLTSVLFGFTSWWMDHPRSYSPREMAVLCLNASLHGFLRDPQAR